VYLQNLSLHLCKTATAKHNTDTVQLSAVRSIVICPTIDLVVLRLNGVSSDDAFQFKFEERDLNSYFLT
jgi:hypothetical protein